VTRARVSQILSVLQLAPEIQEAVLFLEPGNGRERITERSLRAIAGEVAWARQRRMWAAIGSQR
jgi:hypothetical protein